MSRQTRNLWSGGIILGCAAGALFATGAADTVMVAAESNPIPASVAIDDTSRFMMNPFSYASNPQQKLLKEWLDIHQKMATPVKYATSNSPRKGDARLKGC